MEKCHEDDQEVEIKSYKEKLKGLDMVTLEKRELMIDTQYHSSNVGSRLFFLIQNTSNRIMNLSCRKVDLGKTLEK